MKKHTPDIFILSVLASLTACTRAINYGALNHQSQAIVREAEGLVKEGKTEEGVKMLQVVKQIHPDDPSIRAIVDKLPAEDAEMLKEHPVAGFNKSRLRARVIPRPVERALWFIPDRLRDLIDMFTAEANFGPQVGAGLWLTRGVQAVAYVGTTAGIGYYQKTLVGARTEGSTELVLGPAGGSVVTGARAGAGGFATTVSASVFQKPEDQIYQEYRDYWSVGVKLGFILIGIELEHHPLEILDFFAGWVMLDPLNDDLATSRRLNYSAKQKAMLKTFTTMVRDAGKKGRAGYAEKYPSIFSKK